MVKHEPTKLPSPPSPAAHAPRPLKSIGSIGSFLAYNARAREEGPLRGMTAVAAGQGPQKLSNVFFFSITCKFFSFAACICTSTRFEALTMLSKSHMQNTSLLYVEMTNVVMLYTEGRMEHLRISLGLSCLAWVPGATCRRRCERLAVHVCKREFAKLRRFLRIDDGEKHSAHTPSD